MIIRKNDFEAKFLMVLCDVGFTFLAIFSFILNENYTPIAFGYLFLVLVCIVMLGLLGYVLCRILTKKYYRAEETKIVLYERDIPIQEFNYKEMKQISYTKIWYVFLGDLRAGDISFYYDEKPYRISMTYKQAIQFQKISKLMITTH